MRAALCLPGWKYTQHRPQCRLHKGCTSSATFWCPLPRVHDRSKLKGFCALLQFCLAKVNLPLPPDLPSEEVNKVSIAHIGSFRQFSPCAPHATKSTRHATLSALVEVSLAHTIQHPECACRSVRLSWGAWRAAMPLAAHGRQWHATPVWRCSLRSTAGRSAPCLPSGRKP